MKFTCTQENLRHGLSLVAPTASKNTTLPILNNVLIKAEKGVITLATTNLELGVSCTLRGKVDQDGIFTVQAKLLSDFVNLVSSDTIDVELDGDVLIVQSERNKTAIKGNPADEFPLIPELKKDEPFTCSAKELKEALAQVLFSVSHAESRPEITGVYMKFENGGVVLAATDSYRLAEKMIKCAGTQGREVIIPARTLGEVVRVLNSGNDTELIDDSSNQEQVEIFFQDNQAQIRYKNVDVVSRMIEGTYPAYTQIIPSSHKTVITVEAQAFAKAVKTASLFSRLGVFDVKLSFKDSLVTVEADNTQIGQSSTEVEARIEGEENKIVLNHKYLTDGLQNMNSTYVSIEMNDEASPCVLKPAEKLEENTVVKQGYLYIIMPIKQ